MSVCAPVSRQFLCLNELPVFAGDPDGPATIAVNTVDNFFVHGCAEDHLYNVHSVLVGDPHTIDKFCLDIQALEKLADLWATAMNNNGIHAYQLHEYHVPRKALLQGSISHGVAAKFDDKRFPREALDVRQRLGEDAREVSGFALIQ